ncbi:MAG: acetyl-CoA carboxylase carboxyltransferase subunit alpha [Sandaracinobacteroides sp.]
MAEWMDFEKSVGALSKSAADALAAGAPEEASRLAERARRQLEDLYGQLSPWQRTQVARHPQRPHFRHYCNALFPDLIQLGGDRLYGEDAAILGGIASFEGRAVVVIGHAKGEDTESRIAHNFGMGRPEGYRKAVRLMELADRFQLPVITLVDTPGAFPGIDAEERGQAEAIARAIEACLSIGVPTIAVICGEGGSGGAIALAAANHVLMLEHAVYAVISPEGCASILWRDGSARAADAAEAMRITAPDLLKLGVIDRIIYEPVGGAHRDHGELFQRVRLAIATALGRLSAMDAAELRADRRQRFLKLAAS